MWSETSPYIEIGIDRTAEEVRKPRTLTFEISAFFLSFLFSFRRVGRIAKSD